MRYYLLLSILPLMLSCASMQHQQSKTITVHAISAAGIGKAIGTVRFEESAKGLVITPRLHSLSAGLHGFHIHEKPSCETADKEGKAVAGLAAGGHFDPHSSAKHEGPDGHGHHGDLPALIVNNDGTANTTLIAPRLSLSEISGRSLMIHEGGDNYSDSPKPLGGGGARIACGVIE